MIVEKITFSAMEKAEMKRLMAMVMEDNIEKKEFLALVKMFMDRLEGAINEQEKALREERSELTQLFRRSALTDPRKGSTIAPKYELDGNVWSGRGSPPTWVKRIAGLERVEDMTPNEKEAALKPYSVKYKLDNDVWSGHGPRPDWIIAYLDGGEDRELDALLVEK